MNTGLRIILISLSTLVAADLRAQDKLQDSIHPAVELRTRGNANALQTGGKADADASCGPCHDTRFIHRHNTHRRTDTRHVTCFDCHASNVAVWTADDLDEQGRIPAGADLVHRAHNRTCAACHGIIDITGDPVRLPPDFERNTRALHGSDPSGLTRYTGAIYSGAQISAANLNIENRSELDMPWDVHAERLVACADCHFSGNNPTRATVKRASPGHLRRDPRTLPLSDYIRRPDHRLANPDCTYCHNALATHDFLPHRERHMAVLDCQACHVPRLFAPVVSFVDETVLDSRGTPIAVYRNGGNPDHDIRARRIAPAEPFLLPYRTADGTQKVGAFGMTARWYWEDATTGRPVAGDILARVFPGAEGRRDSADVSAGLDDNRDGRLNRNELHLDTPRKVAVVAAALKKAGINKPRIQGGVFAHRIAHGIVGGAGALRDCEACHGEDSRFGLPVHIADRLPGNVVPDEHRSIRRLTHGQILADADGLRWQRFDAGDRYYIFGHSRSRWSDTAGFVLFALTVLAILAHGGRRIHMRRRHPVAHVPGQRVYMYSLYERIWHWLMAAAVIALLMTGLEIHAPGRFAPLGFSRAVTVHNFAAVVLVVNAFLALFFHLATAAILQFIPRKEGLLLSLANQIRYYTHGIFLGHPHPTQKTVGRKLNPLQQITYLILLNVLFPLQVVTGIAIWTASKWPDIFAPLGALSVLGPVHNMGSWLFLTFLVVHLYLTTTGHTVFSNLSAMVDGWDETPAIATDSASEGGPHA